MLYMLRNDQIKDLAILERRQEPTLSWFTNENTQNAPTCQARPNCGIVPYVIPDIKVPDTLVVDTTGSGLIGFDPDKLAQMIAVAQGNVLNNTYYAQNLWKAQYDLLTDLMDHPTYLTLDPVLVTFYNQHQSSELRRIVDFDRSERSAYKMSPEERVSWLTYQDSIGWYRNEIDLSFANTSPVNTTLVEYYETRIAALSTLLNNLISIVNVRGNANINTLKAYVNGFQTSLPWVQKKKFVMAKRLDYLVNGHANVSSADVTLLNTYAHSCHLENGVAVYEAQALLDLYNGFSTTWIDSCATIVTPRTKSTQVKDIFISPNPTSNVLTIRTPLGQDGVIEIFDAQGVAVQKIVLQNSQDNYNVEVADWLSGIYYLKVLFSDNTTSAHKFIKI